MFSSLALGFNLVLLVAILSMLQATLTLPGMAAMALALGMAIDSNVLINERVREELRSGVSPQAAIHAGYDRAWATILDSNVTTLIVGLALLLFCAYTWITLHLSYSEGERAGFLQKFSKRGWICKTWEGELALVSLPGSVPEKFAFTIRDDAVAAQVTQVMGKRVSLHYDEKVGLPTSCFGETMYYVDSVTVQ